MSDNKNNHGYLEPVEGVKCPDDLRDAVNNSDEFQWIVYDMGLMPEQITTMEQVCALRAAWMMYNALTELRFQSATPPPSDPVREAVEAYLKRCEIIMDIEINGEKRLITQKIPEASAKAMTSGLLSALAPADKGGV